MAITAKMAVQSAKAIKLETSTIFPAFIVSMRQIYVYIFMF